MKSIVAFIALAVSTQAFAGTGQGAVTCSSRFGEVVAVYSFFHSAADSYSSATVFIQNNDSGRFDQFTESNEEALKPVTVKTPSGELQIRPDAKLEKCVIVEIDARK